MRTDSTIPIQISDEAGQHIEQLGLQEPFRQILDEIPKRFQAVHYIKVDLQHIYDEPGRLVVTIDVARGYPGRDDPSGRQFDHWLIETFPTEIWEHFGLMNIYVDAP